MKTKAVAIRMLTSLAALMAAGSSSPAQYVFTELEYPGVPFGSTYANGIDGANIVGQYWDTSNVGHGFFHTGTNWITLDAPGAGTGSGQGTLPFGISGTIVVGSYMVSSGLNHGFLYNLANETWTTNLDDPLAALGSGQGTKCVAIAGTNIVGAYYDGSGALHGFLHTGTDWTTNWITLNAPGAGNNSGQGTQLTGISGANIAGTYYDSSGNSHGVLYSMITSNWTYPIDDPQGPNNTVVYGISGSNISGSYYNNGWYGFVYNSSTWSSDINWTTLFDPLASPGPSGGCFGHGISGDTIVGAYYNNTGLHGYVATPIPRLALTQSTNGSTISWLYSPFINWTLQQNPDFTTTNWSANSATVSSDGTNNTITIAPSPSGNMFFRLVH